MKRIFLLFLLTSLMGISAFTQSLSTVKGKVISTEDNSPMGGVMVYVQNTNLSTQTTADGLFDISNIPTGEQILRLEKTGFQTQYQSFSANGDLVNLGELMMFVDVTQMIDTGVVAISDDELSTDESGGADNIAGLLLSSKDPYQQAVAYNFSQVFFRERGYDSNYGQILFNGIPMNKFDNGRPQWSEWGGINDMMRNTEFASGVNPAESTFGGVLGSTNYLTRASGQRVGGRVSYAFANTNYVGRAMASYNSGLLENGWAFSVLGSRRFAQEGYMEGSSYNAWSGYAAIEKRLNDKHSLNLTAFYTPNRRGKNSPNTQEVYDLAGTTYNAYWGWQEGDKRNSRMKEIKEPTFFLSHYWDLNSRTSVNTNVMYQYGTIGNSRLGYDTYDNPDPTYYKDLPSYYTNPNYINYQLAYENTQKFLFDDETSQVMWKDLYTANRNLVEAAYYQYEDVNDDKSWAVSSIINTEINDNVILNGSLLYKNTNSENYAHMMDLLGAEYQIDNDKFENPDSDVSLNDVNNPDRLIYEGDKFSYDYIIDATQVEAFAQSQFKYEFVDFFVAANLGQTTYQREGLYLNGKFPDNSFGKSDKANFTTFGIKGGATYKLTGRHLLNMNGAYMVEAPTIRDTYSNIRVYDGLVPDVSTVKITTGDLSYIYRGPGILARLTGYHTTFRDLTKVSYYFVQGVSINDVDEDAEFLATALSGMDLRNMGAELGFEAQINPTVKITGAASIGQFTYDNNPDMYTTINSKVANQSLGKSYLKDYFQSGTPQRGYSFGAEYRDPDYWWIGANANYLTHNYISLSEFRRIDNFYKDSFDGLPIEGLEQAEIDRILAQERLDDAFIVNLIGGKSWKIKDYYLGFFASVNNLLGESFKTGGFEQARKANYTELFADQSLDSPLFGNKYWYGRGTTYYLNFYIRF